MEIKIRFFTVLRDLVGAREEMMTLETEKATVALVLKKLSEEHGQPFIDYVFDNKTGFPKGFLQFLINGTSVSTLNGLETELKESDVLAILPPVGGG